MMPHLRRHACVAACLCLSVPLSLCPVLIPTCQQPAIGCQSHRQAAAEQCGYGVPTRAAKRDATRHAVYPIGLLSRPVASRGEDRRERVGRGIPAVDATRAARLPARYRRVRAHGRRGSQPCRRRPRNRRRKASRPSGARQGSATRTSRSRVARRVGLVRLGLGRRRDRWAMGGPAEDDWRPALSDARRGMHGIVRRCHLVQ